MGYPVLAAGMVLAPRGIGTMLMMFIVGRLIGRIDSRLIIGAGLLVTARSLYEMSGFTPDVSAMGDRPDRLHCRASASG